MLDKTSLMLLFELCKNGKASNAELAEKLGISLITVSKKIKTLLQDGTISIKAIPNPAKMGYRAAAFIGLNVDIKSLDDVCNKLKDDTRINLLVTCFGRFDVLLIVYFQEWSALNRFLKYELPAINGIKHIEASLISDAKKRYHDALISTDHNVDKEQLDEIDHRIIKELMQNGRQNYSELAKKLGTSVATISRRISSLIKNDLIDIVAIPNPAKLGYFANAFVLLNVESLNIESICNELSRFPEIHIILKLLNNYDILFGVNIIDVETLYDFLKNKIGPMPGILKSETFICGNFLHFNSSAVYIPSFVKR